MQNDDAMRLTYHNILERNCVTANLPASSSNRMSCTPTVLTIASAGAVLRTYTGYDNVGYKQYRHSKLSTSIVWAQRIALWMTLESKQDRVLYYLYIHHSPQLVYPRCGSSRKGLVGSIYAFGSCSCRNEPLPIPFPRRPNFLVIYRTAEHEDHNKGR